MVLIQDQIVNIKWHNSNKEWYISKGYQFSKMGDIFEVKLTDLTFLTNVKVKVQCEICEDIFLSRYDSFNKRSKNDTGTQDICEKCNSLIEDDQIKAYKLFLDGKLNKFPKFFFRKLDKEKIIAILEIIYNKIKTEYNLTSFKNMAYVVDKDFLAKYRLNNIIRSKKITTNQFCLDYFGYDINVWQLKVVTNNYWKNETNVRVCLEWFMDQIFKNKELSSKDDLKNVDIAKLIKKYKLTTVFGQKFNNSKFQLLDFMYPNYFKPWEMTLPTNYFENDDNKREAIEWLIEKLIEDDVIKSIEDIPNIVSFNHFEKYNLRWLIVNHFNSSPFVIFNFYFPDKWKFWEFKRSPDGLWNMDTIKEALFWFVGKLKENQVIISNKDICNISLKKYLYEFGLSSLPSYTNVIDMLIGMYPELTVENFKKNISNDGLFMDSKEEVSIHNFLIKIGLTKYIKYCSRERKKYNFINNEENEGYIPDWIDSSNGLIIEYFGLYSEFPTAYSKNYKEKTDRKIKYYNSLNNYIGIYIFPDDLRNNFEGLTYKLNKYYTIIAV